MATDPALERLRNHRAEIAIVLGSGLNALLSESGSEEGIAYSEFAELPNTSVPGHAGRFILGKVKDTRMILAQGRVHLYEGHSARNLTAGVRLLASAGIKRLILTNAAGLANEKFSPGS
jgi:purine-nucleoside phosphorylase